MTTPIKTIITGSMAEVRFIHGLIDLFIVKIGDLDQAWCPARR
jgi:hypothetical protein